MTLGCGWLLLRLLIVALFVAFPEPLPLSDVKAKEDALGLQFISGVPRSGRGSKGEL